MPDPIPLGIFILIPLIPGVAAAGLDINPVNTATFSIYIILVAYTLFQAVRAFGILRRPQPKNDGDGEHIPPERVPYAKIFLATLTLLACYVMETIWTPIDLSKDNLGSGVHNVFYGMLAADQLSDIFIASALLHFIDHQRDTLGRRHKDAEPTTMHAISSTRKRMLDTILLAIMAGVTMAGVVIGTVGTRTFHDPDVAFQVYINLYHVYIALYIAVTLNIVLSAWFLRRGLSETAFPAGKITIVIWTRIVPLLIVRVLFKLSVDITTSVPSTRFDVNFDVLGLVEAIVECVTYAAVLYISLSLARPVVQQKAVEMKEMEGA